MLELRWQEGRLHIESRPPLPVPLAQASGATVGDFVFVVAGSSEPGEQTASKRVFQYDVARPRSPWRELESLPGKPRLFPVTAAYENSLYVIGGVALEKQADGKMGRVYLRDFWRYQEGKGWKQLADLPKAIAAAPSPAPVVDGRIFLLGGDDGSRRGFEPAAKHPGWPRSTLIYEIRSAQWREAGETPAPRATVPCVEWRERFVVPSGEVRPGVRSPEVWAMSKGAVRE